MSIDEWGGGMTAPEVQARRAERQHAQMQCALEEIRDKAATMPNGGAWAAGLAALCLGTLTAGKGTE